MRRNKNKTYHLLFFILQPFFTFVHYLINFKKPQAKNIMWLFAVFYGATFAIGDESTGSDINRYVNEIGFLNGISLDMEGALLYFYSSGEVDVLRTFLAVIVSSFTGNGYYLIIVFSVIYGYFYSRNMWYILDRLEGKTKNITRILIFCLFFAIPLWNMNGFRFWTAAHVFIFGLLPFLFEGNKKSLIWCLITPFLIHFGFLVTLIPLGIFVLFGNKFKLYYIFFVLTLFISDINIISFNKVIETYAPQSLIDRSENYREEDKVSQLREGDGADIVWYAKYYTIALRYTLTAFLLVICWNYRKGRSTNDNLFKLLGFILLFYGFANIFSTLPSGYRFLKVANLLTLSFLVIYFQEKVVVKSTYLLSKTAIPFLIFFIIISIRLSWYSLSTMTIIGNPITAILTFGDNLAINDIIKGF